MNILIAILVGTMMWALLGTALDFYGVRPIWYMLTGYWFYPLFQFIMEKLDGF